MPVGLKNNNFNSKLLKFLIKQ